MKGIFCIFFRVEGFFPCRLSNTTKMLIFIAALVNIVDDRVLSSSVLYAAHGRALCCMKISRSLLTNIGCLIASSLIIPSN